MPTKTSTLTLQRLAPQSGSASAEVSVREIAADIHASLHAQPSNRDSPQSAAQQHRPRLILNMVSSVDGRTTLAGRSGALGGEADRELLHGLRTTADALLVGAGTARAERYARILRNDEERAARVSMGLAPEPLTCIVSATLNLTTETVPLLAEPSARIALITSAQGEIPPTAASVQYLRASRGGEIDLMQAMRTLRQRLNVRSVLCEGGPTLASKLLMSGLIDELFLCVAPKLTAEKGAKRLLSGIEAAQIVPLRLISVHEHDCHLFMRYSIGGDCRARAAFDSASGRDRSPSARSERDDPRWAPDSRRLS